MLRRKINVWQGMEREDEKWMDGSRESHSLGQSPRLLTLKVHKDHSQCVISSSSASVPVPSMFGKKTSPPIHYHFLPSIT